MQLLRSNVVRPGLPEEVRAGSAVARLLWAHRGQRDGLTLAALCGSLGRRPAAVLAQLAALRGALAHLGSPWALERWVEPDALTDEPTQHWLLTSPWCPRPPRRTVVQLGADGPDLVSLEELAEDEL